MIGRADLVARVGEWGLREDVVEKDYVLGWLLWGIGSDRTLADAWVFKGGTCLKKCYIETYRFSEDLDFTVMPGGPIAPEDVQPLLAGVLARVTEASGIDFSVREPRLRLRPRPSGQTAEGRVFYRGPRDAPPASVKLDLSGDEPIVQPTVLRPISHPYPDALPGRARVRCYGFEEVFAEKLRAMGERGRPRDLYDIIHLFRRPDLQREPALIRQVLAEKCAAKDVPVPTLDSVVQSPFREELESEWANMLAHQLPALPPLGQFLQELERLFAWLEGAAPEMLAPLALAADEEPGWSPPPTAATWGAGIPLETVRFAAVNRLCVELGYQGSRRVIEPYSLRRTRAGKLVLHAIRVQDRQHRSYRVDRIESVRVTNRPFRPVHAIEFTPSGSLRAPRATRSSQPARTTRRTRARRPGLVYLIKCPVCGKTFRRRTRDTSLRVHKAPGGWNCSGRRGYFSGTEYA